LTCWIDSGEADNNPNFPWDKLDRKGLALTKLLSQTLGDIGVPIVYRFHYNNPNHSDGEEVIVSYEKNCLTSEKGLGKALPI